MRFARVSRPNEVRMHELSRDEARTTAFRTGHVVQSVTGRGLDAFMPPSLSQLADAYRHRQLNAGV
jgi:hypothetical protein